MRLDPSQPIVDKDGKPTDQFRTTMSRVNPMLSGSGSPEGVVDATQGALYMDTAGVAGTILYVKRDPSVTGNTRLGWILC